MSQLIRFNTDKTFAEIAAALEESILALRSVPSNIPALPGMDPPMQAVYSLIGEEGQWVQLEVPDELDADVLEQIRTTVES